MKNIKSLKFYTNFIFYYIYFSNNNLHNHYALLLLNQDELNCKHLGQKPDTTIMQRIQECGLGAHFVLVVALLACLSALPLQSLRAEQGPSTQVAATIVQNSVAWRIASQDGEVRVRQIEDEETPGAWRTPQIGERLTGRVEVETRDDGRIWLVRDGDIVTLHGSTSIVLPEVTETDTHPPIEQLRGRGNYQVQSRPGWTFKVKTPYLLALVKGTTFDIEVGSDHASLAVTEGVVNVSTEEDEPGKDVSHGQTAQVSALSPSNVLLFRSSSDAGNSAPRGSSNDGSSSAGATAQSGTSGNAGQIETAGPDQDESRVVVAASNGAGPSLPGGGGGGDGGNGGTGGGGDDGGFFGTPFTVILIGLVAFLALFGPTLLAILKTLFGGLMSAFSLSRGGSSDRSAERSALFGKH